MKRDDIHVPDNMHISNNYTQATRVRIEIMKAIVKKFQTDEERMFLNQFCNRPIIRITNTRTKYERVWTFTNLIETYGQRLNNKDLEIAYKRAGYRFTGQMKQLFGVLQERTDLRQNNSNHQEQNQTEPPAKKTQFSQASWKKSAKQDNNAKKKKN